MPFTPNAHGHWQMTACSHPLGWRGPAGLGFLEWLQVSEFMQQKLYQLHRLEEQHKSKHLQNHLPPPSLPSRKMSLIPPHNCPRGKSWWETWVKHLELSKPRQTRKHPQKAGRRICRDSPQPSLQGRGRQSLFHYGAVTQMTL